MTRPVISPGTNSTSPMAVFALNMDLGLHESEIRLMAITVVAFTSGTILILIVCWSIMQVVDRVKARKKNKLAGALGTARATRKQYDYKSKKGRRWDYFFRRREQRNGQGYDDDHPLVDIEATRTRAMLYQSSSHHRITPFHYPQTRSAQALDLPQVPFPTYSPPLGSPRSPPEFSPPSYRTDPSDHRLTPDREDWDVSEDEDSFARLRMEISSPESNGSEHDDFALYSPPPTRIPSPPPPVYTSPAFSSTPLARATPGSPSSVFSSPSFSPSLGMDLDYYMEWSGSEDSHEEKESIIDQSHLRPARDQVEPQDERRFGWAAFSALFSSTTDVSILSRLGRKSKLLTHSVSSLSHYPPSLPTASTGICDTGIGLGASRVLGHDSGNSGFNHGSGSGRGRGSAVDAGLRAPKPLGSRLARVPVPVFTEEDEDVPPVATRHCNQKLDGIPFAPSLLTVNRISLPSSASVYSVQSQEGQEERMKDIASKYDEFDARDGPLGLGFHGERVGRTYR